MADTNLPNEQVITESDSGRFKLSNYRVRLFGGSEFNSIMLENMSAIRVQYVSKPMYLIYGAICLIAGAGLANMRMLQVPGAGLALLGVVFIIAYFVGRRHEFILEARGGGLLAFSMSGMKQERAVELASQIEHAMDARVRSSSHR